MNIQTIILPVNGYGTHAATLTAYVQHNIGARADRERPAVVICPGGGYEFCSDREAEPVALAFVARGYQAFVLDYTVVDADEEAMGHALLPAPQRDLANAVAEVRGNAHAWHVDASRIAIIGFSAGGHLCATYSGVSRDPEFARDLGFTCEDIAVSAQILCYPVIDLAGGWPKDPARVPRLCGEATPELLSAQKLVDAGTPRTFIWHTASDQGVPVRNSYVYAEALAAAGVDHDVHVFHAGPHGLSLATEESAKDATGVMPHVARWFDLAIEWLEEESAA